MNYKYNIEENKVKITFKNNIETTIDIEDLDKILNSEYSLRPTYDKIYQRYSVEVYKAIGTYKSGNIKYETMPLHRFILNINSSNYNKKIFVRHKDGNCLNNCRKNIYVDMGGFNDYKIENEITKIYLKKRNGEIIETIIDTEELQKIISLNFSWHVKWEPSTRSYYCTAIEYYTPEDGGKRKRKTHYIHNIIMNSDGTRIVDHKDNNTLDNRKDNLRIIDKMENLWNRKGANSNSGTGVRNVNYGWHREYYVVQFMKEGVKYRWEFPLSQFTEACEFADIKRKEIFGELNAKETRLF